MLLACPLAVGQSAPAPTRWQQHPDTSASALPPPPPVPGLNVASPSAPGSRVVLFSKPAGEVTPVQATAPVAKDDKPNGDNGAGKNLMLLDQSQRNPFELQSDSDLAAELNVLRDYPNKLKDYEKQQQDYARELELFKKGMRKEPPLKPYQPQPIGDYVLPPTEFQPAVQVKAGYTPGQALLEPGYVVHRRLYFEELNSERYGWDLGFAQPFVSAGVFFKDVLFWPSHLASNLHERYDTSAGKCPPGSPVAYYLYPPNITFRGGLVETGVVVGTVFLLP